MARIININLCLRGFVAKIGEEFWQVEKGLNLGTIMKEYR
jgi:hypothetical protein